MKIRILKDILVEVYKNKLEETWDKQLHRWTELNIKSAMVNGSCADLHSYNGDIYRDIPLLYLEIIQSTPAVKETRHLTA
jgi:hypothetical protein